MVKIKVKKEMELPELLRWASDNDIKGCKINGDQGSNVLFNKNGWVSMNYFISLEENFEVEVEEEITEETEIPTLIIIADYGHGNNVIMDSYCSIKDVFERFAICAEDITKAIYMLNDDMTMTLIWRNGGMVE